MEASIDVAAPTVVFKRKRGPPARPTSASTSATPSSSSSVAGPSRPSRPSDSDSDDQGSTSRSSVIIKKKRTNYNPLVASTGSVLRRSKLDDDFDQDDALLDLDAPASSASRPNKSLQKIRDDATRHSNWDLDPSSASIDPSAPSKDTNSDGLYRGAKGYQSYIAARDDGTSSKMRSRGPIRQTTTVRTTSLMDYQPDICKDYKETGYCGFGDTCKFLHDRSDYLAGWQLDVLPNSSSRTREDFLSDPEAEDDKEEEVPFACLICRQEFTDPVVTQCGHYFCSSCAIKRFAKNGKCFACGKQTGGLFNSAKKVLDKMEAKKRRKAESRAEKNSWKTVEEARPIAEFGKDASDSDDDKA